MGWPSRRLGRGVGAQCFGSIIGPVRCGGSCWSWGDGAPGELYGMGEMGRVVVILIVPTGQFRAGMELVRRWCEV